MTDLGTAVTVVTSLTCIGSVLVTHRLITGAVRQGFRLGYYEGRIDQHIGRPMPTHDTLTLRAEDAARLGQT